MRINVSTVLITLLLRNCNVCDVIKFCWKCLCYIRLNVRNWWTLDNVLHVLYFKKKRKVKRSENKNLCIFVAVFIYIKSLYFWSRNLKKKHEKMKVFFISWQVQLQLKCRDYQLSNIWLLFCLWFNVFITSYWRQMDCHFVIWWFLIF